MIYSEVVRAFGIRGIREADFTVQLFASGPTWRVREFRRYIHAAIKQ